MADASAPRGLAAHVALVLLALACVGTGLALTPGAHAAAMGYERFALVKELTAVALVLGAAFAWLAARRGLGLDATALCLAGVTALAAVSALGAPSTLLAWRGLGVAVVTLAAYLVASALAREGARDALVAAVLAAAALVAAAALGEAHGLLPGWSLDGRAPGGTEGNRNFMAHALVLVLPVALAAPALTRRRALRRLALAAVVLIAWTVVLTRSRGAWLGATAAIAATALALTVARRRAPAPRARRALAASALALALGIAAALAVPNELAWRAPVGDTVGRLVDHRGGSGRGRLIQYATTARLVAANAWLGVGPGNWSVAYPAHARACDPSYTAHATQPVNRLPNSDWLGFAAERGVPATLGFLAFLLLAAAAAWRAHPARAAALTGVLAAIAVCGTVDAVLLRPTPALLAAVLLGALGAPGAPLARTTAPPARAVLALATLALAVALVATTYRAHAASRVLAANGPGALQRAARLAPDDYRISARVAQRAAHRGACDVAVTWARRTLAAAPHHALSKRIVADCAVTRAAAARPRPAPP